MKELLTSYFFPFPHIAFKWLLYLFVHGTRLPLAFDEHVSGQLPQSKRKMNNNNIFQTSK